MFVSAGAVGRRICKLYLQNKIRRCSDDDFFPIIYLPFHKYQLDFVP